MTFSWPSASCDLKVPYRVFSLTWPAPMQIYRNKRKLLHKKRVQLPEDWFGTPTWPPFHCFGTPIWPPWRHVKTLYRARFPRYNPMHKLCIHLLFKENKYSEQYQAFEISCILLKVFFFFFHFLTQHEWCCFKHEKISFFLDLNKSLVRLKVIIKLSQSFAKWIKAT